MQVAVEAPDLRTEDPLVGQGQRVDYGDLQPELAGRRGELAADPAGAHDGHARARVEAPPQRIGIGQRPQVVDALELCAGDRHAAGLGPSGQEKRVIGEHLTVVEHHA